MDTPDHIPERPACAHVRASFAQERMWFLEQMDPENAVYNQLNAFRLKGPLDVNTLKRSFTEVLRRHEALRTNLGFIDGQLYQFVSGLKELDLPVIDLSNVSSEEAMAEAGRLAVSEAKRPFDLEKEPLIRAFLLKLSSGEHMLVFITHHAIFDGWSVSVLINDLAAIYEAYLNRSPPPPMPPIQYADYALWQREKFERGDFDGQLNYWMDKLKGTLPILELPIDHKRPMIQSYDGAVYTKVIPPALTDSLKVLARREKATLFVALLAAYYVLLRRYTGQRDVIFGCPIAGRNRQKLEGLIGLFVNTLPIRIDAQDPVFIDLLRQIRQTVFEAYDRQDLPFEKLVETLPLNRLPDRTPIFQTFFHMRNFPDLTAKGTDIAIERYDFNYTTAKQDLTLEITETPSGLSCRFEYATALFDEATIVRMADHWQTLLTSITESPYQSVSKLPLLTEAETRNIVVGWNDVKTAYPRDTTVHRIFEERVKTTPDAMAILHGNEKFTYRELNSRANRLARFMQSLGISRHATVAICMDRSIDLIACELAVLKAGGVYIPMDPSDPPERTAFMIKDVHASVVLTRRPTPKLEKQDAYRVVCLEDEHEAISRQDDGNLIENTDACDIAYIIYTSGSTGQPKGVRVPHRAINRLVLNTNYVKLGPGDVMAHLSNPAFDAATFEVWGALLNGALLVVYNKDNVLSPAEFAASVEKDRISTMFMTTQLFSLFAHEIPGDFKNLRDLFVGGETIEPSAVKLVMEQGPPRRLINVYGPTENTTFSICYHIQGMPSEDMIPIGRTISNSTAYILDEHRQPVPVGVIGELYLGGDGVAEGYHERPDLTASAFIPDIFSPDPGRMLYRTGDMARFLPDGNICFEGRRDTQVKIRGFRVEASEIKAVLETSPEVRSAIVTMKVLDGEKRLVAYMIAQNGMINTAELREHLRKKLPEYMIPSYFLVLDAFPLTPTGKIDYRSLPMPGAMDPGRQPISEGPRDKLERDLARIWAEVLSISTIGIDDSFFDIGGHSLAAVQALARIEVEVGVKLPISSIFTSPTVRSMAQLLRESNRSHQWKCLVPLKPEGVKPSLFCVHTVSCMLAEYNSLIKCLNISQSIYGIQPVGLDGSNTPLESIEAMAAHYVKEIRAFQPQGPYLIMGYSSGGVIAYEMARQLREQGFEVSFLCLIEPYIRNRNYYDLKRVASVQSFKTLAGGSITVLMHLLRIKTNRTLIMPPMMDNMTTSLPYRISRALRLHTPVLWTYPDWVLTMSEPQRQVAMSNYEAFIEYLPVKHKGDATLFISRSIVDELNGTALGWEKLIEDKLEVFYVPGDHASMVQPPNVESLALNIECLLDRVLSVNPIKPTAKASDKR